MLYTAENISVFVEGRNFKT